MIPPELILFATIGLVIFAFGAFLRPHIIIPTTLVGGVFFYMVIDGGLVRAVTSFLVTVGVLVALGVIGEILERREAKRNKNNHKEL